MSHAVHADVATKKRKKTAKKPKVNKIYCTGTAQMLDVVRKVALVVGDAAAIRHLLHKHQRALYSRVLQIHQNSPTRWGMHYTIAVDMLASKAAIVSMVRDEEWATAASGSKNSGVFEDLDRGEHFLYLNSSRHTLTHQRHTLAWQ